MPERVAKRESLWGQTDPRTIVMRAALHGGPWQHSLDAALNEPAAHHDQLSKLLAAMANFYYVDAVDGHGDDVLQQLDLFLGRLTDASTIRRLGSVDPPGNAHLMLEHIGVVAGLRLAGETESHTLSSAAALLERATAERLQGLEPATTDLAMAAGAMVYAFSPSATTEVDRQAVAVARHFSGSWRGPRAYQADPDLDAGLRTVRHWWAAWARQDQDRIRAPEADLMILLLGHEAVEGWPAAPPRSMLDILREVGNSPRLKMTPDQIRQELGEYLLTVLRAAQDVIAAEALLVAAEAAGQAWLADAEDYWAEHAVPGQAGAKVALAALAKLVSERLPNQSEEAVPEDGGVTGNGYLQLGRLGAWVADLSGLDPELLGGSAAPDAALDEPANADTALGDETPSGVLAPVIPLHRRGLRRQPQRKPGKDAPVMVPSATEPISADSDPLAVFLAQQPMLRGWGKAGRQPTLRQIEEMCQTSPRMEGNDLGKVIVAALARSKTFSEFMRHIRETHPGISDAAVIDELYSLADTIAAAIDRRSSPLDSDAKESDDLTMGEVVRRLVVATGISRSNMAVVNAHLTGPGKSVADADLRRFLEPLRAAVEGYDRQQQARFEAAKAAATDEAALESLARDHRSYIRVMRLMKRMVGAEGLLVSLTGVLERVPAESRPVAQTSIRTLWQRVLASLPSDSLSYRAAAS